MRFDLVVYKRTTPYGDVYICTDAMLERLRQDGREETRAVVERYEMLLDGAEELRFSMRVYTWGECKLAENAATDWSTGTMRLNFGRLQIILLAKALDTTESEVEQLHPQLGRLLWDELELRANPPPFVWSSASYRQPSSAMANPPSDAPKSRSSKRGSAEPQNSI